jgi:hypothetical protein
LSKKVLFAAVAIMCVCGLAGLAADESSYYYVNIPLIRVYTHQLGYKVVYRLDSKPSTEAYLPLTWFVPGGKGELVVARGPSYPYMAVFYKDGKFSHVRLFLQENPSDPSWGTMRTGQDLTKAFAVEEPKLDF